MNSDEYWPYARAMAELKGRLQATDDEIRMWVYLGHADGGLDMFDAPLDCPDGKLPKRHFTASEVGAYYLRHQIESFAPDDSRRYLTLPELVTKWVGRGLSANKADELVRQLIEDGRLTPINALRGHHAQVMDDGAGALIPDLSLFALDQVIEVEALEFSGIQMVVEPLTGVTSGAEIGDFSDVENHCENAHLWQLVSADQPIPRRINKLGGRNHILTSIIDDLLKVSTSPERASVVFTELVALTNSTSRPTLLLGFDSKKKAVKYRKTDGEVGYFNKKNMDDFLRRKYERAKKQPH